MQICVRRLVAPAFKALERFHGEVLLHTVDHLSAYVPSLQALSTECYTHLGNAVALLKQCACIFRSG